MPKPKIKRKKQKEKKNEHTAIKWKKNQVIILMLLLFHPKNVILPLHSIDEPQNKKLLIKRYNWMNLRYFRKCVICVYFSLLFFVGLIFQQKSVSTISWMFIFCSFFIFIDNMYQFIYTLLRNSVKLCQSTFLWQDSIQKKKKMQNVEWENILKFMHKI